MAPDPTPHVPGNMTVSFLFGWQGIVLAVVLLLAAGVAFLLISASRSTRETRAEWQDYLAARSRGARTASRPPGAPLLGSDESGAVRPDDGLRAVPHAQFGEDALDVGLHGLR